MIQIYDPGNDKYDFNGDVILEPYSCECTMILNGAWSLELEAPIDKEGKFKHIVKEAVISAPTPVSDRQLFRIYETEKTDSSITAIALPIFYDSKDDHVLLDVRPTGKNGQQALDIICAGSKYSGESNITKATTAYYIRKNLMEAINGDLDQSFISRWGGEILYDNYKVVINNRVGGDYGARAEFGYNLEGIKEHVDMSNVVTRIIPVAYNGYTLDGNTPWVDSPNIKKYQKVYTRTMEFSDIKLKEDSAADNETACDTIEELRRRLIEECQKQYAAGADLPEITYEVDMVSLEGTEEYKDYKNLEKVGLGDDVKCKHYILEIETTARVTELTYDCINRRNRKIKLGKFYKTAFDSQFDTEHKINSIIAPDGSVMAEKVQGILNGIYTQLKLQSTVAKKVNGRAFTVEDIDPDSPLYGCMTWGTQGLQLAVRRTADGRDWDWTTAVTARGILADAIIAGILTDKTGKNYWNLDTGEFRLSAEAFKVNDQTVEDYVNGKINGMTQEEIFNILTNNQKNQGIYLKDGLLYINGSFVNSGKVKGEYIDARNLTVKNLYGKKTLAIDSDGNVDVNARSLSILGSAIASEAYADKQAGNLLKGSNLTENDVQNYWDVADTLTYGQSDPMGGKNAVKLETDPIFVDDGSPTASPDGFLSANYSQNNPITAPGVYEARVWLKADQAVTINVSINRTVFNCSLTTVWKQYRFMLDVKTPNTQGFQNFTIGGWGSITDSDIIYIYKPEIVISYSPTDILNLLTNNGAMDGVFIRNNQLYVKGTYIDVDDLKALKATIGGFTIGTSGIYKGCTSLTSTGQGVYMGTNGLRLYSKDSSSNEISFTFDLAKKAISLIGTSLLFKMRNFSDKATLDGSDGTITCKYGLHVYTKRGPDISDDSYDSELVFKGLPHITSGTMLVRESSTSRICTASSSSKRYKDHIAMLKDTEAEKLLDIPVVWFRYKEGYLAKGDRFVDKPLPGFYAEDVFRAFPECAMQNPDTSVEDWNYRTLIPPMLKLIQIMHNDIKKIKEKIQ